MDPIHTWHQCVYCRTVFQLEYAPSTKHQLRLRINTDAESAEYAEFDEYRYGLYGYDLHGYGLLTYIGMAYMVMAC